MHDNIDLDISFQQQQLWFPCLLSIMLFLLSNGSNILGNNVYSLFMPKHCYHLHVCVLSTVLEPGGA